jgi:hypothetical protein
MKKPIAPILRAFKAELLDKHKGVLVDAGYTQSSAKVKILSSGFPLTFGFSKHHSDGQIWFHWRRKNFNRVATAIGPECPDALEQAVALAAKYIEIEKYHIQRQKQGNKDAEERNRIWWELQLEFRKEYRKRVAALAATKRAASGKKSKAV